MKMATLGIHKLPGIFGTHWVDRLTFLGGAPWPLTDVLGHSYVVIHLCALSLIPCTVLKQLRSMMCLIETHLLLLLSFTLTHDDWQAKRMHISMCIKRRLTAFPHEKNCFMVLLHALMSICAENAVISQIVKAIRQALPGSSLGRGRLQTCHRIRGVGCLPSNMLDVHQVVA